MAPEDWSPHPILLISPCFLATFYTLQFFRKYGTSPTTGQRSLVIFLLVLITGPRFSLRIVTCALHIIEIDQSILIRPGIIPYLISHPHIVWTIPHTHDSVLSQLNRPTLFSTLPSLPYLRLTQCQHNIITPGRRHTQGMIQQARIHYPNSLVGLPREEIIFKDTKSKRNVGYVVSRKPTSPYASIFAEVGAWILPGIRMDHVYIWDYGYDDLERHHPVSELTLVRGPLLGATESLRTFKYPEYNRKLEPLHYCE